MSTFTMPQESWGSATVFGPSENPPPTVGAVIEITGVKERQKKDGTKDFIVADLVTTVDDKEYKFDQWWTVSVDGEPSHDGIERYMGFVKAVGRLDTVDFQDGEGTQDFEAMEETVFTADIVHKDGENGRVFVNFYNIMPKSHGFCSLEDLEDPEPEDAVDEVAEDTKPKPKKPGSLKRPGAKR